MLEEEEFSEKELVKIYVLNLVDTNKEKDIHLADFLVDKKMAVYDKLDSEKLVVPLKEAVTKDAAAEPLVSLPSPEPTCPFPASRAQECNISPPLSVVNVGNRSEAASASVYGRSKVQSRASIFSVKTPK